MTAERLGRIAGKPAAAQELVPDFLAWYERWLDAVLGADSSA